METNECKYAVRISDYNKHIEDKLMLYAMVKTLIMCIRDIPRNRSSRELLQVCCEYEELLEKLLYQWELTDTDILLRDKEELVAGFFRCLDPIGSDDKNDPENKADKEVSESMRSLLYRLVSGGIKIKIEVV